jgi:hypothetical protein
MAVMPAAMRMAHHERDKVIAVMPEITLANVKDFGGMMVEVGAAIRRDIKVDGGRTPSILSDIEFACRDILLSMLEAGQDSLGSHVSLNYVGAVVLGGTTTVAANISKLEKRRVTFERL